LEIELLAPEEGVAPGQACVIYDGLDPRARVLGGGTILRRRADALTAAAA
jgi:tRNA-specific 2-thiouridylase